ncbi:adenylyltransferase/cytidyltransferase family protein [bacterium]|nr:adenylyltransferase/cytidyltransferase family protein [bacterium]
MAKIIIVSGYFNPIHKGHLEYFEKAKENGDKLWVIVNNDHQRALKGSKAFQAEDERLTIVKAIRTVDLAFLSIDEDRTVIESLKHLKSIFGLDHELYFANGGDQNNDSIPEAEICDKLGIGLIDGLGNKIQSSSWLLKK